VAGKFTYSPITAETTYPYLAYTLKAWDEYMTDGILYEKVMERIYGGKIDGEAQKMYALMGAFTDAERYLSRETKSVTSFSRKPTSGEVCSQHESVVYPSSIKEEIKISSVLDSGPTVNVLPLSGKAGLVDVGTRKVYVETNASNRIEFQFVNGLGVVESISAESLEALETSGTSEITAITAPASFNGVNRMSANKSGRRPKYKMSTGAITQEWAEWWHNEFFDQSDNFRRTLAQSCWIKLDGHWWPCAAILEDDTTIYERTQNGMVRIDFTVHLAIDGLMRPRI
jgi:hypothetical protein